MSESVQMPALGESVTEGTVTRWLKQVGDTVAVDEPLLEISTDKVDTEIPSPLAGTLLEILVDEDETVEVGAPLARIGSADETGGGGGQSEQQSEQGGEGWEQESEDAGRDAQPPARETRPEPQDEPAEGADDASQQQTAQVPEEVTRAEPEPEPAAQGAPPSGGGDTQDVPMPALGESVTEGTVTRWLKQVGDDVELDEPLLEISTDKVDTEIPSPVAGKLVEILVEEDETVEVGATLARIGGGAAQPGSEEPRQAPAPEAEPRPEGEPDQVEPSSEAQASLQTAAVPEAPAQQTRQPVAEPAEPERRSRDREPADDAPRASAPERPQGGYLTPLVRKLAAERGVDLSKVTGTGVGGRIRKEDVLQAAEKAEQDRSERAATQPEREVAAQPRPGGAPQEVSPLRGTTEKASRLRQIIASRMVEALQSMAQLTTVVEVDMTKVARLRSRAKDDFAAREGVNLSFLPFFVLAATEALKAHPKVNGILEGNQITYHGKENVGIAVDTDRGLVVPVIREAGDLNLAGIARKIADLAARTRENKVTPDELSGATFTVTNTGWGGAVFDTPIVPVGTSAILGTGAIIKRPVVATDEDGVEYIAIRSMCFLALSYDHRLVDGADAARYLQAVKKRLEEGDFEAELGL
jgi:2-oxoglutarate dehydrogenase E2 component (dihydrolipoamide succinyltransferase)